MEILRIIVKKNNRILGERVRVARTFWQRFCGLMMAPELEDGEGLLISPCNSIHMMFMRFPIDAVFINANNQIKALYKRLSPWFGISSIHKDACSVIELKAGTIEKSGLEINDFILMEQIKC